MAFDPNAASAPDSGVFGLPHTPQTAQVVLLPVPFEATTSYGSGTVDGPAAILRASRQVDLFDVEVGRPYERGIAMLPEPVKVRAWNDEARPLAQQIIAVAGDTTGEPALRQARERVDAVCARVDAFVMTEVDEWLRRDKVVGTIGGDHAIAFGAISAHAARYPGLGILHIDAHADLRHAYEGFQRSHASVMENVVRQLPQVSRLVQVGIRDLCDEERQRIEASDGRILVHYDVDRASDCFRGIPWATQVERIVAALPELVYVSFDIDGLDPTLCPHTGTPVPGGLSFHEASFLLGAVARSGRRLVGFDLVEVAPGSAGDEWDGNVAARLLYKLIGWTLWSQR